MVDRKYLPCNWFQRWLIENTYPETGSIDGWYSNTYPETGSMNGLSRIPTLRLVLQIVYQEYIPWDWFYRLFINTTYPLRLVLQMVYQKYLPWDWFYRLFINTTYPETGSMDGLSILPTLRLVLKMGMTESLLCWDKPSTGSIRS